MIGAAALLVDGVWNPFSIVTNSSVALITGDSTSHKHSCCAQRTAQLQQDELNQAGAGDCCCRVAGGKQQRQQCAIAASYIAPISALVNLALCHGVSARAVPCR